MKIISPRRPNNYAFCTILILLQILIKNAVESWSIIEKPLSFFDLSNNPTKCKLKKTLEFNGHYPLIEFNFL